MNFIVPDEEKYICGQCEETVAGGRYNNHCPHCLWSKHLDDRVPGDRVSTCQALMEPVGVTQKKSRWRIVHQCIGCQKHTVVDSAPKDDIDLVIKLSHLPLPDDFLNNKALRRLPPSYRTTSSLSVGYPLCQTNLSGMILKGYSLVPTAPLPSNPPLSALHSPRSNRDVMVSLRRGRHPPRR